MVKTWLPGPVDLAVARSDNVWMSSERPEVGERLQKALGLMRGASRIVVLSGAGISTDSGIPDFRGPQGLWRADPEAEKTSSLSHYLGDEEVRRRSWRQRLESPAWHAVPNAGHRALVELERQGRLVALVTQNIDGLHQKAGNSPEAVLELHGTMHLARCWSCGWQGPMEPVLTRVRAGEPDPRCELCSGILKSATISFGQALDPDTVAKATKAVRSAEVILAVGTTLSVYPAASLVPLARSCGAKVVILNGEPTAMDRLADALVLAPISEALPVLVSL
jgi:NAD-dependent deacetylase